MGTFQKISCSRLETLDSCFDKTQRIIWNGEMATIYLIEQGTYIYKTYQRFVIQTSDKKTIEIPIREVETILVFGNIQLSTPVINACLEAKITVLFLSRQGQYKGHLWNLEAINLDNHLTQFKRREDEIFKLNVSSAIVKGKLLNSKQLLLRLNRKRKIDKIKTVIEGINSDLRALSSVNNLDTLRGYEGISAARYFPAFGCLITNSEFSFCHRYRHPPIDPVNSLLSFGYTLLFNNVLSLIIAEGLSPYLGVFHYGDSKKPYLGFDLMEEFRSPIIDSLVLTIVNKSLVSSSDFEVVSSEGAVYLNDNGRRVFLKHFEARMNEEVSHPDLQSKVCYRRVIQLQIKRYKQSLLSVVPYEPFLRAV